MAIVKVLLQITTLLSSVDPCACLKRLKSLRSSLYYLHVKMLSNALANLFTVQMIQKSKQKNCLKKP